MTTYDPVDDGKHQDSVVFAQILVGNDGTQYRRHCVVVSTLMSRIMSPNHHVKNPYHSRRTGRIR